MSTDKSKSTDNIDFYRIEPRTESEYLATRVVDQITWYDGKSKVNKQWFLSLKVIEIIFALFIPFLTVFITENTDHLKIIVGLLGITVAAIAGIITLIKFQENWIEYRTVAESLKLEKFLFLARTGPYQNQDNSFVLFVERFESLISNSTKKWVNYISKNDTKNSIAEEKE
jgi:uncharacterized membrane protein YqaE (UPF0057 family)